MLSLFWDGGAKREDMYWRKEKERDKTKTSYDERLVVYYQVSGSAGPSVEAGCNAAMQANLQYLLTSSWVFFW